MPQNKQILKPDNHAPLKHRPASGICTGLAVSWCEKRLKGNGDTSCVPDAAFATLNHAAGAGYAARKKMVANKNMAIGKKADGSLAGWDSSDDSHLATFLLGAPGVYLVSLHRGTNGAGGHTVAVDSRASTFRYYDSNTGMWMISDAADLAAHFAKARSVVGITGMSSTVEELVLDS